MPKNPPHPAGELGALPGFKAAASPEEEEHPDELSPSPGPSATSSPPASSPSPSDEESGASTSSGTAFTDEPPPPPPRPTVSVSAELAAELENFSGGLFELAGLAANRLVRARQHSNTRLWLVTEEEAQDFGAAAGRLAARRIPDELKEGDGADVLIMGSVLLGYGTRNVMGVTGPDLAAAAERPAGSPTGREAPAAPAQQPPPPPAYAEELPPPAAPAPPPPAATSRSGGAVVVGVEEATPPPPFSPDL